MFYPPSYITFLCFNRHFLSLLASKLSLIFCNDCLRGMGNGKHRYKYICMISDDNTFYQLTQSSYQLLSHICQHENRNDISKSVLNLLFLLICFSLLLYTVFLCCSKCKYTKNNKSVVKCGCPAFPLPYMSQIY